MRMELIKLAVGIVAAFGSTFLGVYVAHTVERNEKAMQQQADFKNAMGILNDGCELTKMQQMEKDSIAITTSDLLMAPIQNNVLLLGNLMGDDMWALLVRLSQLENAQIWYNSKLDYYNRTFSNVKDIDLSEREKIIKHRTERELISGRGSYSSSLQNVCDIFGSIVKILDAK